MLNVVIVEDEIHSQETLRNLLIEFCQPVNVVGVGANVDEAVDVIRLKKPDLIFLDVELQTGTGFDVLNRLKNMTFTVIFTTAFEHYALKAQRPASFDPFAHPVSSALVIRKEKGQRVAPAPSENPFFIVRSSSCCRAPRPSVKRCRCPPGSQ